MKLLLTSAGISNQTLLNELQSLAAKPLSEYSAVFIPTAANDVDEDKAWLINNLVETKNCGFHHLDIVDIAALEPNEWKKRLSNSDVIFMGGGNTFHLMHWITKSGLQNELAELLKNKIYVGISAGSLVMGPKLDIPYNDLLYPGEDNEIGIEDGLGLVSFCLLPHLNSEYFTNLRKDLIAKCAEEMRIPTYAVDDQTAVRVVDGKIDVVGEGQHLLFESHG